MCWPKKAGLLSSSQPSHQPCTILCLSCSSWLLASSIMDPALVLPYCDNSSHPQLCANKYLFGFVAMFAATAIPWPLFLNVQNMWLSASLSSSALLQEQTCSRGQPIACCHLSRKVLACTCPKLLLNKILKISACYEGWRRVTEPASQPA